MSRRATSCGLKNQGSNRCLLKHRTVKGLTARRKHNKAAKGLCRVSEFRSGLLNWLGMWRRFAMRRKWDLLYSVLWRIAHENHNLLKVETDDEVIQLLRMERCVSHDVHHVHAFVRFKKVTDAEGERYVAWYKPDHKSIRLAAPFFAERFASMRWSILTPDGSAHWDGKTLRFGAGVDMPPANARWAGRIVEPVLRDDVQSGADELAHDAIGDAAAILEQHAGADESGASFGESTRRAWRR